MKQDVPTIATLEVAKSVLYPLSAVSAVAAKLVDCIDNSDFVGIYGISPIHNHSEMSSADWFAYNLLRKYPFKGIDRKKVAIDNFLKIEEQCRETNNKLLTLWRYEPKFRDLVTAVRNEISRCLGRFDWDHASKHFAWGPGATTRLQNREGDVYFKFRGKPETTLANLPLAVAAVGCIPTWFGEIHPLKQTDMFRVVPGSKITTVPKSAKTDRTIAIEPCMNMYIQKGIGRLIRNRLKRVGVNLQDQTWNQELAKLALSDLYSTIDLSNASDSVCYEIVDLLLPVDWATALKHCRSPRYTLNGEIKTFHKFSTMGNGYTFELESLLFWAISRSIYRLNGVGTHLAIYGDDIVCDRRLATTIISALSVFGFETNTDKSFLDGKFFESCGKHYLRTFEATPVYIDAPVDNPSTLLWLANSIARWGERVKSDTSPAITEVMWRNVVSRIPESHLRPIPNGVGDGGLVIPVYSGISQREFRDAEPFKYTKLTRGYQRGFCFTHWVDSKVDTRNRDPEDVPYLLRQLYKLGEEPSTIFSSHDSGSLSESGILKVRKWKRVRGWSSSWSNVSWN